MNNLYNEEKLPECWFEGIHNFFERYKELFKDYFKQNGSLESIRIDLNFKGYKNDGTNSFNISKYVYFTFLHYKYTVFYEQKTLEYGDRCWIKMEFNKRIDRS